MSVSFLPQPVIFPRFETPDARSLCGNFFRLSRVREERVAAHGEHLPGCAHRVSQGDAGARVEVADGGSFSALSLRLCKTRHGEADAAAALLGAAHVLQIPRAAARAQGQPAEAGATAQARQKAAAGADRKASG